MNSYNCLMYDCNNTWVVCMQQMVLREQTLIICLISIMIRPQGGLLLMLKLTFSLSLSLSLLYLSFCLSFSFYLSSLSPSLSFYLSLSLSLSLSLVLSLSLALSPPISLFLSLSLSHNHCIWVSQFHHLYDYLSLSLSHPLHSRSSCTNHASLPVWTYHPRAS